jgi:xanthine dehydrogenase accessory factor
MIKAKLAARAAQLTTDRVPFVLATVVRARRPTSVRPGDTALVRSDGVIEGFVGGHCAASSVRLYAMRALETGEPILLRLLPDGGETERPRDGIEGVVVEHNPCLSGGALEIFLEPRLPEPRIVIVGDSPVAQAFEQLAVTGGYTVEPLGGELAGAAAVVVASHGDREEQVLAAALSAGVPYVALVASRNRGASVRAALDLPRELSAQLHTPAGVDIGAKTPVEIAISILAELILVAHSDSAPERPPVTVAIDPICGMQVAVADSAVRVEVSGSRIYFCSEACRSAYASAHATDVASR